MKKETGESWNGETGESRNGETGAEAREKEKELRSGETIKNSDNNLPTVGTDY